MEQHRHHKRNRGCTGMVSSYAPLVTPVKKHSTTRISRLKIKQITKQNKTRNKQKIKQNKTKQSNKLHKNQNHKNGKYFQHR